MRLSRKRSDQLHFLVTYQDREDEEKTFEHCFNRIPDRFLERLEDSRRGTLVHKIIGYKVFLDGETCPGCKQVITSPIKITKRTGRPPKTK